MIKSYLLQLLDMESRIESMWENNWNPGGHSSVLQGTREIMSSTGQLPSPHFPPLNKGW